MHRHHRAETRREGTGQREHSERGWRPAERARTGHYALMHGWEVERPRDDHGRAVWQVGWGRKFSRKSAPSLVKAVDKLHAKAILRARLAESREPDYVLLAGASMAQAAFRPPTSWVRRLLKIAVLK